MHSKVLVGFSYLGADEPEDFTKTLELPVSEDIDSELEALECLRRIGNMRAAREFFHYNLEACMADDPYVFIKYAEMLFDMGDYNGITALVPQRDLVKTSEVAPAATSAGKFYSSCTLFNCHMHRRLPVRSSPH